VARVFGPRRVQVLLIRDVSATRYDQALVTTDLDASPVAVIEQYASRWSIEVAIEDARQVFGAGQAPSRTARAVERTIPFQLACQAIATCWYATAGHAPADTEDHRARAPWCTTKTQPSTADMAAKLRHHEPANTDHRRRHAQDDPEPWRPSLRGAKFTVMRSLRPPQSSIAKPVKFTIRAAGLTGMTVSASCTTQAGTPSFEPR
jgi:hypothetical protein